MAKKSTKKSSRTTDVQRASKPPKIYSSIGQAKKAREQGKIRGARVEVHVVPGFVGAYCYRIIDQTGAVRLDIPLDDAIRQLSAAQGFGRAVVAL